MQQAIDVSGLSPESIKMVESLVHSLREKESSAKLAPVCAEADHYPLRGTPVKYDAPFEPIALDDWEALK